MALTTLDPKTALVVIDLQKGIVACPPHTESTRSCCVRARWLTCFATAACRSCSSTLGVKHQVERNRLAAVESSPPDGPISSPG